MAGILAEVANALHWDLAIPRHRINAKVENGWVTLQGVVERAYQKSCAEADARRVPGVIGVKNEIEVRPAEEPRGPPPYSRPDWGDREPSRAKLRLVIHTCSNEHVARAALLSIGGELAARVAVEAVRYGLPIGSYVARALQDFGERSDLMDWAAAERVTRGADQPILAALYFILERCLRRTAIVAYDECLASGKLKLAA